MKPNVTKALMLQGTGSNVGKTILATALCRIFLEEGMRVAPFKSQNMALNSYVTRDGLEMSRAQALQAQACRIEPDVRMNPILLKPNSDTGAQVVLMGKSKGTMSAKKYMAARSGFLPLVRDAYASLSNDYDVMVIEGAGSPAEINLMADEIVNMRVAELAHAPVLLVGDIDQGGVFASLVGTLALLPEDQNERIRGFIINKFRGDRGILEPGLEQLSRMTQREVLGVIPYLKRLLLPEEDSVAFKEGQRITGGPSHCESGTAQVTVAVLDLPRISNFTDFDPFFLEHEVELRIIREGDEIGTPDALMIPGSKSVAADLSYLQKNGLADDIRSFAFNGGVVVGICAGFQMMGEVIEDPFELEGPQQKIEGLGLFHMATVLEREKILRRVMARHLESGHPVSGYEIHHGRTELKGYAPLFQLSAGTEGVASTKGNLWGTYLHGVFDQDSFRHWFIDRLRQKKGLPELGTVQVNYRIDDHINRLASVVRSELQMEKVLKILQQGG